ncbi:MAG: flagellin lysine-N-methylase, partial [Oscillospiraceae bacterium]|nr:flagellin lysine-N-methylase [Oscillospiraceae bacterium]
MAKNNVVNMQFYRQPKYYNKFSCIGGSCPMTCCSVWRVKWLEKEVEKLKNAECSDTLKGLIESSFIKDDNGYIIIKMNNEFRCPFLTEDNFCRIQKELGVEYMSRICMIYPRLSTLCGNTIVNYCNLSCYHVMDMLCNESDCMELENYEMDKKGDISGVYFDPKIDLINHPELKFRQQLFEFFYEILSDDSHSIETSVILGALAAQKL